ncbi:amidohydrolase [Bifidobacterium aquikefiricola]|uniref:Amidohydrolase n=1 Tax=Bifidobacterium aquikefiricola TaxID=3059038 RepID=A0AB39U5C2_9BIFI
MFAIDTVFENAHVQTMDPKHPYATTIGVHHGNIVAIDDELEGVSAREHIDLQGKYVCPGFNDVHLHFSLLGANLNQVDLRKQTTTTLEQLYAKVETACVQAPEGQWVLGWGFDQFSLGAFPDIARLDQISHGHPVLILHLSNHAAVINSEAFKRAGYEHPEDIEDTDLVIREHGRITGLVKDSFCFMVTGVANRVSEETLLHQLKLAADCTLALGITSFSDAGTGTNPHWEGIGMTPSDIGLFQTAYDRGLIQQRGTLMPYYSALHDLGQLTGDIEQGFGLDLGMRTGFEGGLLDIGPAKVILDGAFNSLSAYLSEPYLGHPDNYGVLSWDPEEFTHHVAQLHRQGWRVAVHAIGDRAINLALDAFEHAQRLYPRKDVRHRLEHCGIADDTTVNRIIADGIIANPQGSFIKNNGDAYVELLGEERARRAYRMGAFVSRGAIIPGSTDAPCAPVDPMVSIEGMVTRTTAQGFVLGESEKLSVDQALSAYTYGSAYASHKEHVLGSISVGKLADFVVLNHDPHDVPADELHTIEVLQTIIGGVTRFSRM